jgi:hypothetical protein
VPNLRAEALPHGPLKGCSRILEPKGHTSVAVVAYQRDERRLLLVLYRGNQLAITWGSSPSAISMSVL